MQSERRSKVVELEQRPELAEVQPVALELVVGPAVEQFAATAVAERVGPELVVALVGASAVLVGRVAPTVAVLLAVATAVGAVLPLAGRTLPALAVAGPLVVQLGRPVQRQALQTLARSVKRLGNLQQQHPPSALAR